MLSQFNLNNPTEGFYRPLSYIKRKNGVGTHIKIDVGFINAHKGYKMLYDLKVDRLFIFPIALV